LLKSIGKDFMSKRDELKLEGNGGGNCVVWKRLVNLDLEYNSKSAEHQGWLGEGIAAERYKECNQRQ
jgi:hypothetical protein